MNAIQYETLDDAAVTALAETALSRYAPDHQGTVRLLTRSENATFRVQSPAGTFALRVHRGNYHEKDEIESELAWLDALTADTDITVPKAITDAGGERIQTLHTHTGEERHAVLFHWLDGIMPTNTVDPASFRTLGEITARFHTHSQHWAKPDTFRRRLWNPDAMTGPSNPWGDWAALPGLTPEHASIITTALNTVRERLASFGTDPDRFGLIHADLRLTNLLLRQGETGVIDFDDCGMGWFLHDLAAAISFEEHHPDAPLWIRNWLEGYQSFRPIHQEELDMIPSFIVQRRIQMTAWLASHAETEMARSVHANWLQNTLEICTTYTRSGQTFCP